MMNQKILYDWMEHPECLDRDTLYELRTLLARYPYFQTVRLLYLKNLFLLHDVSFGEELRRSALYISDRRVLLELVEGISRGLGAIEKQGEVEIGANVDRTLSLIDAFLDSLPEEEKISEPLVAPEITTDYVAYLMKEEAQPDVQQGMFSKLQGQELIDTFLDKSEKEPLTLLRLEEPVALDKRDEQIVNEETDEILDDESYFTETLAKIYIKQQRYSKALEIIRKLNLNYPKKNAYFADQIRFLEKLIINTKSK